MDDKESILISLESRHAHRIYAGTKKVELRRRPMRISPGTTVWIYEKVPVGSITGSATVTAIHTAAPSKLWKQFGSISGLSKSEFFDYFGDVTTACALVLHSAMPVRQPMPLSSLRKLSGGFQPPQFFLRLDQSHPVQLAITASTRASVAINGSRHKSTKLCADSGRST